MRKKGLFDAAAGALGDAVDAAGEAAAGAVDAVGEAAGDAIENAKEAIKDALGSSYGRGAGYPWMIGDPVGDLSPAEERCK